MRLEPVRTNVLAVVCCDYDHCVLSICVVFQLGEEPPQLLINLRDPCLRAQGCNASIQNLDYSRSHATTA